MTPDISLIMPCYNRAHDLRRSLEAYDRQQGEHSFEIIAVDDGSNDQTKEILESFQPKNYSLRVIRQEINQGPAMARNIGISHSVAPLLLFVGDDILPDPYLIKGHLEAHRFYESDQIALLGKVTWAQDLPINTLMAHIDGIGAQQFSYHYMRDQQVYDFRHFYTANISLKRKMLLTQDSWFDIEFPHAVFEDVELSFRLSQVGMKIIYLSHLIGYHYHYHNIWTFSKRQYNAGMMACLVVKKHPAARNLLLGRWWPIHLLKLRLSSKLQTHPSNDVSQKEIQALNLASAYEWVPHRLLDQLYMRLLSYFYYKGMIQGSLRHEAEVEMVTQSFAGRVLTPLIEQVTQWG